MKHDYHFMVSGGRDSAAMVLLCYERGIKGTLVYGNTRLNLKHAQVNAELLSEITGWRLEIVMYDGTERPIQILKDAFNRIPDAVDHFKKTKAFRRNFFRCCDLLKHGPMIKYAKDQDSNACFVLGLKGYDNAIHRIYRMNQLREAKTFYRRIVKTGLLYYYPLRDWTDQMVTSKLIEHNLNYFKSTGCSICPIFCMFENWRKKDPDTWRRSVQFADRMRIKHPAMGQQFFKDCIGVITDE